MYGWESRNTKTEKAFSLKGCKMNDKSYRLTTVCVPLEAAACIYYHFTPFFSEVQLMY